MFGRQHEKVEQGARLEDFGPIVFNVGHMM